MSNRPAEGGATHFGSAASRVVGAAVTLLALTVIGLGGLIRPDRMGDFFSATSAGLMPTMVLLAMAVCGVGLALWPDATRMKRFSARFVGVKLLALLYLFFYTWALSAWGWWQASLFLLASLPLLAGYRNLLGIAASVVLVLASIWAVFVFGIGAPLP
ncbi:tripartite tricarboxylate transporter TctB family protein [Mesorhizobium sp. A556]